jgi:hypothetical protein
MYERIIEFLVILISKGKEDIQKKIISIFSNYSLLKNIKFKIDDESKDRTYIKGNSVNFLLKNYYILNEILSENEKKIFNLLFILYEFINSEFKNFNIENFKIIGGIIKEIKKIFTSLNLPYIPMYLHILFNHLLFQIKNLTNFKIRISEVDQSSFELGNYIMKIIKNKCVSQSTKTTKISNEYEERIKKNKYLNYQKVLNFKINMNSNEKKNYLSRYLCLSILIFTLRSIYLSNKFNFELKKLPNFNFKKKKKNLKKINDLKLDKYEDLKISDEEFEKEINLNFNYDEKKIENDIKEYLKKNEVKLDFVNDNETNKLNEFLNLNNECKLKSSDQSILKNDQKEKEYYEKFKYLYENEENEEEEEISLIKEKINKINNIQENIVIKSGKEINENKEDNIENEFHENNEQTEIISNDIENEFHENNDEVILNFEKNNERINVEDLINNEIGFNNDLIDNENIEENEINYEDTKEYSQEINFKKRKINKISFDEGEIIKNPIFSKHYNCNFLLNEFKNNINNL